MSGSLVYVALTSADGYIEDAGGDFGWAEPDEVVHRFANDLTRRVGTHLYGRRLYETMAVWETEPALAAESDVMRDFAEVWQAADKIVYSRTLPAVRTERTELVRALDLDALRRMKEEATRDLSIGGAELAGHAFRAGLVDECHLLLAPVTVGGGKPALPTDLRIDLELLDERRFDPSGVVYLRYAVKV